MGGVDHGQVLFDEDAFRMGAGAARFEKGFQILDNLVEFAVGVIGMDAGLIQGRMFGRRRGGGGSEDGA
jgi:hypothetical protein